MLSCATVANQSQYLQKALLIFMSRPADLLVVCTVTHEYSMDLQPPWKEWELGRHPGVCNSVQSKAIDQLNPLLCAALMMGKHDTRQFPYESQVLVLFKINLLMEAS